MIYNYIKCESVIAKVMADLNISENHIRITDMREWVFEAVDKIGAPMLYIEKESGVEGEPILKIEDYLVPIPCGLLVLDGVAYSKGENGPWMPMRSDTSIFKFRPKFPHVPQSCCCCDCCEKPKPEKPEKPLPHYYEMYEVPCLHDHGPEHEGFIQHPIKCNAQFHVRNLGKYFGRFGHVCDPDELTYFIKPGWIVTNRKHGYVKLAYKTIATDERGYPLIPDLTSYQEAVYWYVVMKLSFPKYLNGQLGGRGVNNAQNTYFYIQQQWNFYRNQAYAEAMMPTAADMESIKNDWNKLVPEWDDDHNFFATQGQEQTLINDYYYGY